MELDNRIKELIAVGASVTANCQPCLEYHVRMALENGADGPEITEAVEVGKMVRKGAAAKFDQHARSLIESTASTATTASGGCGCGS